MLRKRIAESLTARIFLITFGILLFAGAVTFSFIAWATPSTYTAVINDSLTVQVGTLVKQRLAKTTPKTAESCWTSSYSLREPSVILVGADGKSVDTGARLAPHAVYEDERAAVTMSEKDTVISYGTGTGETMTITASDGAAIAAEVTFQGRSESYTLYVTPRIQAENLAVRALVQIAPWLLLVLLAFSLLCAFFYSRYITRPIVRMSGIAEKNGGAGFSLGMQKKSAGMKSASWVEALMN